MSWSRPILNSLPAGARFKLINAKDWWRWEKSGKPLPPPPVVKQRALRRLARRTGIKVLVETGTFQGDMVWATCKTFRQVISIELSDDLYLAAKERFRDMRHVDIRHGDSGDVLHLVVASLNEPAIFWLDAHYSGGRTARGKTVCPVERELDAIRNSASQDHVVVIDDARLFAHDKDFPSLAELATWLGETDPACLQVANDMVVSPRQAGF